jgi:glycosyltransferase involved in cell wall biosynthesis
MLPRYPARLATRLAQRAKLAGNWPLAARRYRNALAFNPANAAVWVQYGNALKESGAIADAELAYRRSLEIEPDYPDAHLQLGHALKLQRRGNEAIACYRRAVSLDPLLHHASLELLGLGVTAHVVKPSVPAARPALETSAVRRDPLVVIDASDLLNHLQHFRSATGIQRVQIGVIESLLRDPDPKLGVGVVGFRHQGDGWVAIPRDLFLHLANLVVAPAPDEMAWLRALRQLIALLVHGELFKFRDGAALVNLGSSWTLGNYFLKVRAIKSSNRVRYFPFVHDCIPALLPTLCANQTVQDYLNWVAGVFTHADGFLVNSSTTAEDLSKVAALVGQPIAPPKVVRLDAAFPTTAPYSDQPGSTIVAKILRDRRPFVLFVASLEPRKNHLAAFHAWLDLIERRGRGNIPRLVCVGSRSWMVESATELLRSSRPLRTKVRILSGIPDAGLGELYRKCLFTLYPSFYEGWGLPVTESLSHGKVPVVAAIPALRESGGDFAEYFDPGSDGDLVAKLERLIDNRHYRAEREAAIKKRFRARAWRDVAQDIIDYLGPRVGISSQCERAEGRGLRMAPVEFGGFYPMSRNTETRLRPGLSRGEVFRNGDGWWAPEEWGCWLKTGTAEIGLRLPPCPENNTWLHLELRGNPCVVTEVGIELLELRVGETARLAPEQRCRMSIRIDSSALQDGVAHIRIVASDSCDLAGCSGGMDRRVVSIGVLGFALAKERCYDAAGGAASACGTALTVQ